MKKLLLALMVMAVLVGVNGMAWAWSLLVEVAGARLFRSRRR